MMSRQQVLKAVTTRVNRFQAGILLDTNVTLLHLAVLALGAERALGCDIGRDVYTTDHVIVLREAITTARKVSITPHVSTEVDYFVRERFSDADSRQIYPVLGSFVETCVEPVKPGHALLTDPLARAFGVADLSQANIKRKQRLLVTTDGRLIAALSRRSVPFLNPTHHAWS